MSPTGRGQHKPASTASNARSVHGTDKNKKKLNKNNVNGKEEQNDNGKLDLSGSFLNDSVSDEAESKINHVTEAKYESKLLAMKQSFESKLSAVKQSFEAKMSEVEKSCNAKIDIMKDILDRKDQLISTLSVQVGKLEAEFENMKESQNFVTSETTVMETEMDKSFSENSKKLEELENKTQDLEDRSRRDNVVFFGIAESDGIENTEALLFNVLKNYNVLDHTFNSDTQAYFERVHRLGPRKKDATRPRPIIAKMSFLKTKNIC